jgi:hypothetical protein
VQAQLDERTVKRVTDSVANGFAGLIASAHVKDPAEIAKLHKAALTDMSAGAALAGNAAWDAGDPDGELCPRLKWPFPGPRPHWLSNAACGRRRRCEGVAAPGPAQPGDGGRVDAELGHPGLVAAVRAAGVAPAAGGGQERRHVHVDPVHRERHAAGAGDHVLAGRPARAGSRIRRTVASATDSCGGWPAS